MIARVVVLLNVWVVIFVFCLGAFIAKQGGWGIVAGDQQGQSFWKERSGSIGYLPSKQALQKEEESSPVAETRPSRLR